MKIFFLLPLLFSILIYSQDTGKEKISDINFDIALTHLANPNQYFDRVGRKAALMGTEDGSFEMWIWPWKLFRNFELQFFLGTSTIPVRGRDIVREFSATPEAAVITYVNENFRVKSKIFIPVDETAAVIILEVHTLEPLSIVPGFIPVMQPQWPAGIGGQYSYWNDEVKAYVISESKQRGIFLCGSPEGIQMTAPPAHMFADNPIQFRINIDPEKTDNIIPIIIAGSPVKTKLDSVKILYNNLLENYNALYQKNVQAYQSLKENTIRIETPVKKINLAFEWSKAALNNLLVENPTLGKGLVAGYGLSGGGGRPGFSWYFGGDAFINSLAMNSFQDFQTVKDALRFVQKWQRQDNFPIRKKTTEDINIDIGKIAHELSQSEGLIDWWNDYHFGYNHADTSPWYLVAMGDYCRASGDINFIKESWESVKQAYHWCLSKDSNNDALMDLKGAGLGVLEFGSLVKIHNDIYTQVLWTQGLKEMIFMAELVNDQEIKNEAETLLRRAVSSLEEIYWINDLEFYSFGANEEGEQVREKSIYSSSAMMFKLLDEEKSVSTLKQFNKPDMMTDWGVRNLSNKSELYHPSNYNYGTVWPFTSAIIGPAEYNYGFLLQGYKILTATAEHLFEYGLGVSPEVISGDMNQKLNEAYHNQGFSYTGFMLPMMKGLLGLEVDAVHKKIKFAPNIPADWDSLQVQNIKVGNNNISFKVFKEKDKYRLYAEMKMNDAVEINFEPAFQKGMTIESVLINGVPHKYDVNQKSQADYVNTKFILNSYADVVINHKPMPEIYLLETNYPVGSLNEGFKIISTEWEDNILNINIEAMPGNNELGVRNPEQISSVEGAVLGGDKLRLIQTGVAGSEKKEFKSYEVSIKYK